MALIPSGLGNEDNVAEEEREPEEPAAPEQIEVPEQSEQFLAAVAGYRAWWELGPNEIAFVDENGMPVGDPVPHQNFEVDRSDKTSPCQSVETCYLLTPDETGSWITHVRRLHAEQHGVAAESLEQINANADFASALEHGHSGLPEAIERGEVTSSYEIAGYYAEQPATPESGVSRETVLRRVFDEHCDIPPGVVREEVQRFLWGLVAKESRFNTELGKNSATAQQALQLTDDVRGEHLFTADANVSEEANQSAYQEVIDRRLPFDEEVRIASLHFNNVYRRVPHWLTHGISAGSSSDGYERPQTMAALRSCFATEEDWQKYFIAPAMINAYNCGSLLVGDVAESFVAAHDGDLATAFENMNGYDLYYAFTQHGHANESGRLDYYGDDASTYFARIYAVSDLHNKPQGGAT